MEQEQSRATKLEVEKRVLTIQSWIIEGVQDNLILKQAKTKWDIGLRQARKYLKKAYENWKQDEEITFEEKRDAKIAELKQLKRSLKPEYKGTPQGIRTIVAVEKEIIRLEGLIVKRIDVTSGGKPLQMTPEEREARIQELIEKHNANRS